VVRIRGIAPRQIAPVAAVPFEQAAAKPLSAGGRRKCRSFLAGFYNQKVKIYTRTGDAGETALFDGTRVSKADPRVAAYGEVDELNAWLGLARASLDAVNASPAADPSQLAAMVEQIQRDLFALGARLADPAHKIAERVTKVNVSSDEIVRLEGWIDLLESELPPLRRFILAGGSPAGAAFHVARTVCRRAERAIVGLGEDAVDPEVVVYVNRLSDLLFVLARTVNTRLGKAELEW
jgi:cob(I)alamin adenosyltransferase